MVHSVCAYYSARQYNLAMLTALIVCFFWATQYHYAMYIHLLEECGKACCVSQINGNDIYRQKRMVLNRGFILWTRNIASTTCRQYTCMLILTQERHPFIFGEYRHVVICQQFTTPSQMLQWSLEWLTTMTTAVNVVYTKITLLYNIKLHVEEFFVCGIETVFCRQCPSRKHVDCTTRRGMSGFLMLETRQRPK